MPSESVGIKVAGCVRPLSETENTKNAKKIVQANGKNVSVTTHGKEQTFGFDFAFGPDARARTIVKECCGSVLQNALIGYNISFLAFGAVGSGKTQLMTGSEDQPGIIPCIIKEFYNMVENNSGKEFLITASFLEVMDEEMTDMLNPHTNEMKIREHTKLGIYIDGLSELVADSEEHLLRLYNQGSRARKMGTSDIKGHRARSTGIFNIHCYLRDGPTAKVGLRSRISLIDLAGISLSAADKSVNAVCQVLEALKKGGSIPYRDHVLTRVLQDALGGNSCTLALTCVSPADSSLQESQNTLKYAQMMKGIKNKVKANMDETGDTVSHLRDEIGRLRSRIMKNPEDKESVIKLQECVQDLQIAKIQSWEEKHKLSAKYEEERKNNLANRGLLEWVLDSSKSGNKHAQEQIVMMQKEKDQLTLEYRNKKQTIDDTQEKLKKLIQDYSKLAENKTVSESETKSKVSAIADLKEKLRKEMEAMKDIKRQLKEVQNRQKAAREASQGVTIVKGNAEVTYMVQKEERNRLEMDNKGLVTEETERFALEKETAKADVQVKVKQGYTYSAEEASKLEYDIIDLKADLNIMAIKIQCLQNEKELTEKNLDEMHLRQKEEMEIQQLQHFQTFREYREVFEQQKIVLEQRYRGLLEDAIQDAVFLSSRNNELLNENTALQKEVAEKKDKIIQLEAKVKKK